MFSAICTYMPFRSSCDHANMSLNSYNRFIAACLNASNLILRFLGSSLILTLMSCILYVTSCNHLVSDWDPCWYLLPFKVA